MKTKFIAREFNKNGFTYKLIEREGSVALFMQEKPRVVAFEVVILVAGPPHPMDKNPFDGLVERMPSSESWGTSGWTALDEASARRRFDSVVKRLEVAA